MIVGLKEKASVKVSKFIIFKNYIHTTVYTVHCKYI